MNDVMPTVTFCAELAATCAHASFVRPWLSAGCTPSLFQQYSAICHLFLRINFDRDLGQNCSS